MPLPRVNTSINTEAPPAPKPNNTEASPASTPKPQDNARPKGKIFTYCEGQFAYAKIVSEVAETKNFYCECIDGVSAFFTGPNYVRRLDKTPASVGDHVWVRLTEFIKVAQGKSRYKIGRYYDRKFNDKEARAYEYEQFKKYYNCGDKLCAPIDRIGNSYILVRLGPAFTAICSLSNVDANGLTKDSVHLFSILRFDDDKRHIVLELIKQESVLEDRISVHLWSQLPASIKDVFIPDKILEVVEQQGVKDVIEEKTGLPLSRKALSEFLEPLYQKEYADRRITVKQTYKTYYMDFDTDLRNEKGVPISAAFKKNKTEEKWLLNLFGFTKVESVFDRFIYVKNMDNAVSELAALALSGEEWDYRDSRSKGGKYILKQYLRFNFYKSWLDGLLTVNDAGNAVFNTGLVDGTYDPIYCYLKKSTRTDDFFRRRWELDFFACCGKSPNGKLLNEWFAEPPAAPQYIDPNRIQDIYYNTDKKLSCDYDHIVADNLGRLPLDFIEGALSSYDDVKNAVNAYKESNASKDLEHLRNLIVNTERYLREIVKRLKNAVDDAIKYCKWNYKTAIPIYYPRNNTISLLLPLCLTNENNIADVALVVERLANGNYQGQTILTLQMAYLDARQICRPNSEWLTVDKIDQGSDDLDEGD